MTGDVPAYAIVAGVPARTIGWMSAYGDRLDFDERGRATDSQGHVYQRVDADTVRRIQ